MATNGNKWQQKSSTAFNCECGKNFKDRSGLWKHAKKCNFKYENIDETKIDLTDSNVMMHILHLWTFKTPFFIW